MWWFLWHFLWHFMLTAAESAQSKRCNELRLSPSSDHVDINHVESIPFTGNALSWQLPTNVELFQKLSQFQYRNGSSLIAASQPVHINDVTDQYFKIRPFYKTNQCFQNNWKNCQFIQFVLEAHGRQVAPLYSSLPEISELSNPNYLITHKFAVYHWCIKHGPNVGCILRRRWEVVCVYHVRNACT